MKKRTRREEGGKSGVVNEEGRWVGVEVEVEVDETGWDGMGWESEEAECLFKVQGDEGWARPVI